VILCNFQYETPLAQIKENEMKKILLILSLVFWIGCASVINHPITGEKIPVPPKFVNKIDFDLTVQYKIDKQNQNSGGKVASALEESGLGIQPKMDVLGNPEIEIS
jgi:hypothetical protein